MRQTTFAKPGEINKVWRHVDAEGKVLGRLATEIATVLMGKHRPDWTPHIDCGDFVVVTNAEGIVLTGNKAEQKIKTTYSGYPGGMRTRRYEELLESRPEHVIEEAVRRMLPKGRLGRRMLSKLKVYRGSEHPHAAQSPVPLAG
ncbi:MAG: 50S ribosomal protein L13 [Planctomycetota bacterium]